jgi:hypothetical protein
VVIFIENQTIMEKIIINQNDYREILPLFLGREWIGDRLRQKYNTLTIFSERFEGCKVARCYYTDLYAHCVFILGGWWVFGTKKLNLCPNGIAQVFGKPIKRIYYKFE